MVKRGIHLSTSTFVAVSGTPSIHEYTDHLHDAFAVPTATTPQG